MTRRAVFAFLLVACIGLAALVFFELSVQRENNGFGFSNLSPFQTSTVNAATVTATTISTTPITTTATVPSIAGVYPGFNYVLGAGQANVALSAPITTSASSLDGPTIQQRRLESSVVVQDGQTIALGGLIQDNKSYTKTGTPLLSSIPVIGNLFSTTDNSDQRTELLVTLSPRIVHNAQEAQDTTNELRNRLHDYKDLWIP